MAMTLEAGGAGEEAAANRHIMSMVVLRCICHLQTRVGHEWEGGYR